MAEPTTTTQPVDEVITEETATIDTHEEQGEREEEWDEGLDVELIIEDFTIDGICGVY